MIRIRAVPFDATSELIKLQEHLGVDRYLDHMWRLRQPNGRPFSIGKWPYVPLKQKPPAEPVKTNVTPLRWRPHGE